MFEFASVSRKVHALHMNPVVKSYIVSDTILWSAWDLIMPLFGIFIVQKVPGGTLEIAAGGYSLLLLCRVAMEFVTGKFLLRSNDRIKLTVAILGILIISISFSGFAFSNDLTQVLFFYGLAGMGLGTASPAKNSLFAMHLDKNEEAAEWAVMDGFTFLFMAASTALGGIIATRHGFDALFILAAVVNFISIFPYIYFILKYKTNIKF